MATVPLRCLSDEKESKWQWKRKRPPKQQSGSLLPGTGRHMMPWPACAFLFRLRTAMPGERGLCGGWYSVSSQRCWLRHQRPHDDRRPCVSYHVSSCSRVCPHCWMPLALPGWAPRQDLMIKMLLQLTPEGRIVAQDTQQREWHVLTPRVIRTGRILSLV